MKQKTPAELRAEAETAIKPLGQKRIKLLAQLEEIDSQLRPHVVHAVSVELSYRRIRELTAVAPNTARAWHRTDTGEG